MSWNEKLKMFQKSMEENNSQEIVVEKNSKYDHKDKVEGAKVDAMKKFIYLAVDDDGKPMYKNGELIFSYITEAGKAPQWDKDGKTRYKTSADFKVELDKSKVRAEGKDVAKADAKNALRKLAENYQKKTSNDITEEKQTEEQNAMAADIKADEKEAAEKESSDVNTKESVHTARTEVVAAIEDAKQIICEDLANMGDDLAATVQGLEKPVEKIKKNIEFVEKNIQESTEKLSKQMNDTAKALKNEQEQLKDTQESILAKEKTILKKMDQIEELCEVTEVLEGKLNKLDQIDTVVSLLSDKGVEISREFPPVCKEEEDIINLVRYSKKITEQLGYAARDFIRKKAAYDSKEQNIANEQKIVEEKITEAYNSGMKQGKLEVINALLGKYTDIDTIMESDIPHVHAIGSLLKDLGVECDGDGCFKKGNILSFNTAEVEKMSAIYKKLDGEGTYKVVKSGLVYNNEIVFKAEFEKVTEPELTEELQEVKEAAAELINE